MAKTQHNNSTKIVRSALILTTNNMMSLIQHVQIYKIKIMIAIMAVLIVLFYISWTLFLCNAGIESSATILDSLFFDYWAVFL